MLRRIVVLAAALVAAAAVASTGGASGGGVRVSATASPTCPVERVPPDPSCAPKPVDVRVRVAARPGGRTVARARTGSDGRVSIPLRSGRYRVYARAANGGSLPRCDYKDVRVPRGRYVRVAISCDTGIR